MTDLTPRLSRRESEILPLLTEGLQGAAIGARLYITVDTVRTHLVHLYAKLGVHNAPAAVHQAHLLGLLPVEDLTPAQKLFRVRLLLADPEVARALVAEQGVSAVAS